MFEKITNKDIKESFETLKAYCDRRRFYLGLIILVVIIAALLISLWMIDSNRAEGDVDTEITEIKATLVSLQQPSQSQFDQENKAYDTDSTPAMDDTLTITAPVVISSYYNYDEMWEYLEYGDTVEFFHPEDTDVFFSFEYEGEDFCYEVDLKPPQLRALMSIFPDGAHYRDGYQINATIRGEEIISVNWIEQNGHAVWTPIMEKGPRELNALEKWAFNYAQTTSPNYLMGVLFDRVPDTQFSGYSYAEEYARFKAFFTFVTNPDNNVWVQDWRNVDASYRWVDAETGRILTVTDEFADLWEMPESGWLALQIGVIGNGSYKEPEKWETTDIIKMQPGLTVGINQVGHLEIGYLDWILDIEEMACRTKEWSLEKISGILLEITE